MNQILSSREACLRLSIDRSTLTRWVQIGRITPIHKLPGRTGAFLFEPAEIDRVRNELSSATTTADPAP